ncbi:membrane protein [Lentilactobacillus fungorum]|uniref:Membrane protein n=1 Tax=Lentilactobacillus fungorum TaxID=2201250 RepID=A0ABQ3W4A9_9LACO|nr:GtrA family protein [Lentilactobacillus fungorum]GHP14981.1 membrane protein [Lentilactobacillus fungorum]
MRIKSVQQFIKFSTIGLLNTILTYLIYLILLTPTNPTIAMGVGYGITSLLGLALNNRWVFATHANLKSVVVKYYSTYLFTWLLSVGFAHVADNWFSMNAQLIPLGSLLITVPTNFFLSKFWVFPHQKPLKEVRHYGNQ